MRTAQALFLIVTFLLLAAFVPQDLWSQSGASQKRGDKSAAPNSPLVTFVELGSVRCIPCKMMQPVMKSLEVKYGDQIKILFHDVWTEQGQPYAAKFGIRLIPTQVFLDSKGKEFYRHEGFFPEAEIDKLLQKKGLKIQAAS